LSGMLIQMPRLGWLLGFTAMASLGLPGLAGFWGEFPALLASWNPNEALGDVRDLYRTLTVIAAIGTVLAAAYLLWLYQRTAFGTPTEEFGGAHDAHGGHGHVARSLSAAANADHADHADHGDDHHADIHDVDAVEWISWTPFVIAIVVLGIVPSLLFELMDPAVTQLVDQLGASL